ncbi:MAG: hypothetical protein SOS98_00820 [Varibaculum sp.]|nr:hypothetical protein [Varibaculum sp.]
MTRWWLFFIGLAAVVIVLVLACLRGRNFFEARPRVLVANATYISLLPRYRKRLWGIRLRALFALVAVVLAAVLLAVMTGGPIHVEKKTQESSNRDIMLCLDISSSMLKADYDAMGQMMELSDSYDGERVGMYMWNYSAVRMFPLTDDYEMVTEQLTETHTLFSPSGYQIIGEYLYTSPQLKDLLFSVINENTEASSLVGDGLMSCAMGFDQWENGRIRSIILITDNIVEGEETFTLGESVKYAAGRDIIVHGLWMPPLSDGGTMNYADADTQAAKADFRQNLIDNGGVYHDASVDTVQAVIRQINDEQVASLVKGDPIVLESDRNSEVYPWLIIFVVAGFALIARARL